MLSSPDGRLWSRSARLTIAAGYLAAVVGGIAATLVATDGRDAVSILTSQSASDAIARIRSGLGFAVALSLLLLVGWRLVSLRGAARRAQAPLLFGALLAVPLTAITLAQQMLVGQDTPTGTETVARALMALIPLGSLAGVAWSRLRGRQATDLVVELRDAGALMLRDRLARTLGDPTLELVYRLSDGSYVDESGKPALASDDAGRVVTQLRAGGRSWRRSLTIRRCSTSRRWSSRCVRRLSWCSRTSAWPPRSGRSSRRYARRAPLPVRVQGAIGARLTPAVELAGYFVVCEALTNVSKHAHASAATVRLARVDGILSLSVQDNGCGGAGARNGGGLAGLRDRAEALDGRLVTESAPDGGTTIRAEIPCES